MVLSRKYKWFTRILFGGLLLASVLMYGTNWYPWLAAATASSLILLAGDIYNLVLSGLMSLAYASKLWNNVVVRLLIFLGLIALTLFCFRELFSSEVPDFMRFPALIGGLIGGGLLVVIGIFWHQYWYVSPNRED